MDVQAEKIMLQIEEIESGAAASEGAMQKLAASTNFWNKFYEGSKGWFLNGPYSTIGFPQVGVDGAQPCWYNMTIFGICCYNLVPGSSGQIEFDVIRHYANGNPSASIFTTRPKISYLSGANARIIYDAENASLIYGSPSIVQPVMAMTEIDAGDFLTMNLIQGQTNGQNAGLVLGLRPR